MLDYKKDESRWTETTYVPPADLTRYITALAFTMYNADGQKIFTCLNRRHSYTNDFDDQYKDMKDDFADDLKDIKKNKEVLKHSKKIPPPLKYASVIISKSYDEIDDKEVDCMTHIMENFCKEAEKYAKNRLKK